jgi:hypothetical protein
MHTRYILRGDILLHKIKEEAIFSIKVAIEILYYQVLKA